MPIDIKTMPLNEAIYTFFHDATGTTTCIASNRLRLHCLAIRPEVALVPVSLDVANDFLREKSVSMERVMQLTYNHLRDPIILGRWDLTKPPDTIAIDGHHRYVRAALGGASFIKAYYLEPKIWREFEVIGARPQTQQSVINLPHKARDY